MADVERSALVNFSALQMFNLVNDVARYSEFLPGCVSSKIIEQSDDLMVGLMELKKGPKIGHYLNMCKRNLMNI